MSQRRAFTRPQTCSRRRMGRREGVTRPLHSMHCQNQGLPSQARMERRPPPKRPSLTPRSRAPITNPQPRLQHQRHRHAGPQFSSRPKETKAVRHVFDVVTAVGERTGLHSLGRPQHLSRDQLLAHGLKEAVIDVSPRTASALRYNAEGTPCCFVGGSCSSAHDSSSSVQGWRDALLSLGAEEKHLSLEWVENHARWIVWKLAGEECSWPDSFGGNRLTAPRVLHQLRWRYEKEILRATRCSAINTVLNGDGGAGGAMVVCVSRIHSETLVAVTDGWYEVDARLDGALSFYIRSGKIRVGSKLAMAGATLTGVDGGVDPLQVGRADPGARPALVLGANGTRRCKWSTKLGWIKVSSAIFRLFECPPPSHLSVLLTPPPSVRNRSLFAASRISLTGPPVHSRTIRWDSGISTCGGREEIRAPLHDGGWHRARARTDRGGDGAVENG